MPEKKTKDDAKTVKKPAKKKVAKKKVAKKTKKPKKKAYECLVIVESPAKSKTINKILGKNYKVLASMGHIVDLPASRMGIDFENGFEPEYVVIKGRKKYLTNLKKEAKNAEKVYLAADPDREGEAICWHLKNQFAKSNENIFRVSFEEITERAVKKAFEHPESLNMDKINAQQARRLLDRIVGYSISPLLWKKITRGLSAGRVQSVAVKLIVHREEDIRKFIPEEYWSVDATLKKRDENVKTEEDKVSFNAKLMKHKGEKIHITDQKSVDGIVAELENEKFIVKDITRKEKKSHPRSPYTTSVLQQDAFNKLNFSANKTMRIAQGLYEGVELGEEGSVGLITYMRTDSVKISDDAQKEARQYIQDEYGDKYCPEKPPVYKSKKRAQEAHEAIRTTLPLRSPKSIASFLSDDAKKLYTLIWNRFVSSQMTSAVFSVLTVNIDAGEYRFRSGGAQLIFDGFLRPYRESSPEKLQEETDMEKIPILEPGEETLLLELDPKQHFTKPPPRFTDASLIKMLEEKGIGRPSTYAPTIRTIISRNYIKRLGKSLQPTELGELVNKLLVEHFPDIVDDEFTAKMEDELDNVEDGKEKWTKVLEEFHTTFKKTLEKAQKKMESVKRESVATDEKCEECGRPMVIKWGRRGRFMSCSGFPACRNSKSITTGIKCPEEGCEGELVERKSIRGTFYGCTKYPECKYVTRKLPTANDDGTAENANDQQVEEGY